MKEIQLTQGQVAKVSDNRFNYLSQFKWYAVYTPSVNGYYAARRFGKTQILMHREIMDAPNGTQIDHQDGDGLNNQNENLRFCTAAQNQFNRNKQINNSSGFKGVDFHKNMNKWRAKIQLNYKRIHLGYFDSAEEAARAYDEAAKKYYGEFAMLNFKE